MLNRLVTAAAVMIAANAAVAGPPPTEYNLIDFGRTGDWSVTDDDCLRTTPIEQVIRCAEFDLRELYPDPFHGLWIPFAAVPSQSWVVPEVRIRWYRADGLATPADATAVRSELPPLIDTWFWAPQGAWVAVWADVEAVYSELVADGATHLGLEISASEQANGCISLHTFRPWMLQPCSPCLGDYDQSGAVDGEDINAFFVEWERGAACADVDDSGGVDGGDLVTFFHYWQSGAC